MAFKDKVFSLADSHLDFIKKAFSDNGTPSSSRLLTVLHSVIACGAVVYIVGHNPQHTIDGGAAAGLGGFATVHYVVNRTTTAWGKDQKAVDKPEDPKGA